MSCCTSSRRRKAAAGHLRAATVSGGPPSLEGGPPELEGPVPAVDPAEAARAQADGAEQRRLTGEHVAGYRPAALSPWSWDNDQPVECIRWSFSRWS